MRQFNLRLLVLFHCIFPLLSGGLIYVLFRSESLNMFQWFNLLGIESQILSYRTTFHGLKCLFPNWAYLSLPNALWVYSFTSILLIIWNDNPFKYWIIFIPFTTGVLVEFLQLVKLFPGTFDYVDFIFALISFILSILTINNLIKKKYEKKITDYINTQ